MADVAWRDNSGTRSTKFQKFWPSSSRVQASSSSQLITTTDLPAPSIPQHVPFVPPRSLYPRCLLPQQVKRRSPTWLVSLALVRHHPLPLIRRITSRADHSLHRLCWYRRVGCLPSRTNRRYTLERLCQTLVLTIVPIGRHHCEASDEQPDKGTTRRLTDISGIQCTIGW